MRLFITGLMVVLTSCAVGIHADRAFGEEDVNQSTISVNRSSLTGNSLLIQVEAPPSAQLKGTVKINGKVVANLASVRSIPLASCIASSGCEIDVAATYQPSSAISVIIYSPNGSLRSEQQSSGTGILRQKFTLNIQ
jgi:hypothetical protein